MILTEKQQKYQHDHLEKLINMNILQENKYCLQRQIIEHAKFTYSPLGKAFKKQTKTIEGQGEKQIKALEKRVEEKFLDTDQKSIASFFSKDL